MRPVWAGKYLHLPFAERGRTRAGVDCYGLIREVFHVERHIDLPSYTEQYTTTTDRSEICAIYRGAAETQWREVPVGEAQLFDVLVLRILGQPVHFALVLDPPYFLHIRQSIWSTIERWDSLVWKRRIVAVMRWQEPVHG